jgi:hypothetical protein
MVVGVAADGCGKAEACTRVVGTELPTRALGEATFWRPRTSSSSAISAALLKSVMRSARALSRTWGGVPPQRNAETTVLVSTTTRTLGPCGGDLRFGHRGLEGRGLTHRGEEPIDLALAHRLAQQLLKDLGREEPGLARGLGRRVRQIDIDACLERERASRSPVGVRGSAGIGCRRQRGGA